MKRRLLSHLRISVSVAAGLVCASGLSAQSVGSSSGDDLDDSDLIVLSVFEVDTTKDDRYRAGNSVSATGLNTAIKDLPMTIQVVTGEFIKDLGATDFAEALSYTAGVFTSDLEAPSGGGGRDPNQGRGSAEKSASSSAGGNRFANVIGIRGFNVPFQNRLGFRYGGVVITRNSNIALGGILDSVNMDRMEVVKGPNSLLYGVGVISGIANVIPKKPLSFQRQAFGVTVGSNDQFRATVDITGPVLKGGKDGKHALNYRVMGSYETRGDWTDFASRDIKYGALQLDYWFDKKWNVFAEFQKSKARFEGTGSQWIYDDLSRSRIPTFRNEFDEQYSFAQDGDIPGLSRIVFSSNPRGRLVSSFAEPAIEDRLFKGGTFPDSYRITGPDTYQERNEEDFLLDFSYIPSEKLAISSGIFITKADEEELAINARVMNNFEGRFNLRAGLPVNFSEIGSSEYAQFMWGVKNENSGPFVPNFDPAVVQSEDDLKVQRYWWSLRPQHTDSFQWRIKGTYNFETPFIGGDAKHTVLVGYHYINDKVDFLDGNETINRAFIDRNHPYITTGKIPNSEAGAADALYFRSVDDFSVFRFDGKNLAMPGDAYRNQDIFFHGAYGILQSKFFDDRLGLIVGLRYDRYNSKTKDLIRISPEDQAIGVNDDIFVDNPFSIVYDETEPVKSFDEDISEISKTFALNYEINKAVTVYGLYSEGLSPNTSLVDGNNETIPAENTRSIEAGFKWSAWEGKFSGTVALYQITRENAIYQFEQAPAPSKWADSPNPPPGFVPNGATEFNPSPLNGLLINYGVDQTFIPESIVSLQGSNLVTSAVDEPGRNKAWFIRDPVTNELFRLNGLLDVENHTAGSNQPFNRRNYWWLEYEQLDNKQSYQVHVPDPNGDVVANGRTYSLKTVDINWRAYIEEAFSRRDLSNDIIGSFDPIRYEVTPQPSPVNSPGNNPSAAQSSARNHTFVTFEDRARGFDLEFVYSPNSSLQFIFNYAHTTREAQGAFQLVDWRSLATGKLYGTEYDEIFRILGRENAGIIGSDTDGDGVNDKFVDIRGNEISLDNPARPTDFFGGIDGLSLFFNPEDEARFWTRYTIDSGPLKRLGFGAGVRYSGPAQTSIPIGGTDLGQNLFRTPETESRTQFDAALYYTFKWMDSDWRLSLNAYNLTDETIGLNTRTVTDPNSGRTVTKRTRNLYAPRSFRFSVDVSF